MPHLSRLLFSIALFFSLISVSNAEVLGPYTTLDGPDRSLDDYIGKGKWTVVMIWASDCLVCNREIDQYVKFHETHKNKDAEVVGISMDGPDNRKHAEDFVSRHKVTFSNMLPDPLAVIALYRGSTGKAYQGTPTFLVFDPKGELAGAQMGAVPTKIIEEFIANESADGAATAGKKN